MLVEFVQLIIMCLLFLLICKGCLHIVSIFLFSKSLLLYALCTYMLAIESESKNHAETLKNWQGTEISIEEVVGNTFSVVFPL